MKGKNALLSVLNFLHIGCERSFEMDMASKDKMKELGEQIKKKGVSRVYFVHGTWAGTSPLGFVERIPGLDTEIIKIVIKKLVDNAYGDLGNYTESYARLFEESICNNISCDLIKWGSGNYHKARVLGALKLIKEVAKNIKKPTGNERILLIGHSHAGQLFALLTKFLEQEEMSVMDSNENKSMLEQLVTVVGLGEYKSEGIVQLKDDLKKIDKVFLDFVTLGTPPRYTWGNEKNKNGESNYRLLNIINHHHEPDSLIKITGVPKTRDGDYVQQWGVGGTDVADDKNTDIEKIIGMEQYYFSVESVKNGEKRHMPKFGESRLINYGYEGKSSIDTILGHGVYTLKERMLFNAEIIVNEFYKN